MTTAAELFMRFAMNDGPIVPASWEDFDDIIEFLSVPEHRMMWDEDSQEYVTAPFWFSVIDGAPCLFGRLIVSPTTDRSPR